MKLIEVNSPGDLGVGGELGKGDLEDPVLELGIKFLGIGLPRQTDSVAAFSLYKVASLAFGELALLGLDEEDAVLVDGDVDFVLGEAG